MFSHVENLMPSTSAREAGPREPGVAETMWSLMKARMCATALKAPCRQSSTSNGAASEFPTARWREGGCIQSKPLGILHFGLFLGWRCASISRCHVALGRSSVNTQTLQCSITFISNSGYFQPVVGHGDVTQS